MNEFIRRNKENILIFLLAVIVFSLLFIIFYSGNFSGLNSVSPEEDEGMEISIQLDNYYFVVPFILFILSLVSIFLVLFFTRSGDYMLGAQTGKYSSKKELIEAFLNVVIMTNSKATDKNYTLHLLKKIKQSNSGKGFKFITIKDDKPYFIVDEGVNTLSEPAFKKLIQSVIEGFSSSGDDDDPFLTILRSGISSDLARALETYGIILRS